MCSVAGISSQISLMKNANYNSPHKTQLLTPCLDAFFSLNFHHSSLITHHSKIPCLFGTITHFSSLNIFHTIHGSHTYHPVQLFFFFFSSVPKLTEPSEKKKKITPKTWRPNQWKKKKKKRRNPEQTEPGKEEEEEKKKKPRTDQTSERRKKKEPNSQPRRRKKKKIKRCG